MIGHFSPIQDDLGQIGAVLFASTLIIIGTKLLKTRNSNFELILFILNFSESFQ